MDAHHYLLILFWLLYYIAHSVFAATRVKNFFFRYSGVQRYYRLGYTILAALFLALILWYQYSFRSPLLWKSAIFTWAALVVLIIPGTVLAIISIRNYFVMLSGIRSLVEKTSRNELKTEGLHRYMRHPLYTGTLMVVWGFLIWYPYLNNLLAVILLTVYVLIGIRFEEKKLVVEFGSQYTEYKRKVPALIPDYFWKRKKKETA